MKNLKEIWPAAKDRMRRIREIEEGGEKTLDMFVLQLLIGITVAFVGTWLWSGMTIGEYLIAVKWMFDLGEFSSIGIAIALGIFGLLCYMLMFMIGVTHGHFGLPDFIYVMFSIFGATAWVMAILILFASLCVAIVSQFTQLL